MRKKSNSFTLLEILLVVVVMGVMATIISTRLIRLKPEDKFSTVLKNFNDLIFFARQEAISSGKNIRLFFKSEKYSQDFVVIEEEYLSDNDKKLFKQIKSDYFATKYILPNTIKMNSFYKNNKEIFTRNKGNASCYIVPNGLVQPVILYLTRKLESGEQKATFKTQPFLGNFEYFEGFLKLDELKR